MNRTLTALTSALTLFATPALSEDNQPPNILFVFADDLAYNAVGFTGNDEVRTPRLDSIASQGTVFDHCYNSGAWHGAVCVASRTMLYTGAQLWTAKTNEKSAKSIYVDSGKTWSQRLSALGYKTYFTGKWHVQNFRPEAVHDVVADPLPGFPGTKVKNQYLRPTADGSDHWDAAKDDGSGFWKDGTHWTKRTTDNALELLKQAARDPNTPFFLTVSYNAPHDPRQSPRDVLDTYEVEDIRIPENFLPVYPIKPQSMGLGKNWSLRDERLAPVPRTEFMVQTHRREYYAAITYLDQQIGRIFDALKTAGLEENTLVIFTADHGLACGEHGLMGKQNPHEHSVRVPFVLAGPGIPKEERREQLLYLQDVVPFALETAGAEEASLEEIAFQSFTHILESANATGREVLTFAYTNKQRAIRDGEWKLILYPDEQRHFVYHLADDPLEKTDLSLSPEGTKQAKRLFARFLKEQRKAGDPLAIEKTFPTLSGQR